MDYDHNTSGCGGHCIRDLIRARAYQFFEARGRQQGHELQDWLQAEHEVKQHLGFESTCTTPPKPSS